MMLFLASAFAADPPAPVTPPGYVAPVVHITTDPLLPQKYRSVPAGEYQCSVVIKVSVAGKATDVEPVKCDEESLWALTAAILQWEFDPATQNGVPIAADLPYTGVFTVETLLPRKHVVGFVGVVASAGGLGFGGIDGRIHLGEQVSVSGGVDLDRKEWTKSRTLFWTPVFHADLALSSPRQHFEHRGIAGFALGGFGDALGGLGVYGGFRGEFMTPVPGLSLGGDAGLAVLFGNPPYIDDVGIWKRQDSFPVSPYLRLSVLWYAPIPRDQFVVVPREDDPVLYEPIIPVPEPLPDLDGQPFEGIASVHWSRLETSYGEVTPTGAGFANYPPGTYTCNVRVAVDPNGTPVRIRAEACPKAGRADAEANAARWVWPPRPGDETVQAVFPAPIFVRRDDAEPVRTQSVLLLDAEGDDSPLPPRTPTPDVYVHELIPPEWTNENRPTRSCFVDVDISDAGAVSRVKWISGDIEVQPAVFLVVRQWRFYPVVLGGELTAARVRLSMCDYR